MALMGASWGLPAYARPSDVLSYAEYRHSASVDDARTLALSMCATARMMSEGGRFLDIYSHLFEEEEWKALSEEMSERAEDAAELATQVRQMQQIEAMIGSGRWS